MRPEVLCAGPGMDPSWWDADADPAAHVTAAGVCAQCPVRVSCLDAARADRRASGVHGGWLFPVRLGDGRRPAARRVAA